MGINNIMFTYFSEIKNKDNATKQRFVVVATAISFFAIVAIWVPIRIAQWRTPGGATLANVKEAKPGATTDPAIAGDSVIRIFTNVVLPKPTEKPVSTPLAPLSVSPVNSVVPSVEELFVSEKSTLEMSPEPTPSATDFPTL